jgi:Glycosyltransferase family 87
MRRLVAAARDEPWTAALLGLRVVVLLTVLVDVPGFRSAAAGRFLDIAHEPGTPYRDFQVEYPIGELLVVYAVGSWGMATARVLLALLAFGADLAAWAGVRAGWGVDAARRYLWLGTPLLIFIYRRSDLVAVAFAVWGLALVERRRERVRGALFGAAVLLKLWAVVVAPALWVRRRLTALVTSAVTVAAGLAAWVAIGGAGGPRQVVSFRGATGWELESTVGVIVWVLTGERRFEAGAARTGSIPGWARVAMVLALLVLLIAIWRRARTSPADPAGAPALAALATLLFLSPLFSPPFAAWLLPWGAIAMTDDRRWRWLAAAPVILTGAVVTVWYLDVWRGHPGLSQVLLFARNLSLVPIVVAWLTWRVRDREQTHA